MTSASRLRRICLFALTTALPIVALAGDADQIVSSRVERPPVMDGALGDACWQDAALVTTFTAPLSESPPAKPVEARVCFDDDAIYFGITCAEPNPAAIKTGHEPGSEDVWQDDCVEVWLSSLDDRASVAQFIVNAAGVRQTRMTRADGEIIRAADWPAAATIGDDRWIVEFAISFATLGVTPPQPGEMLVLKMGREDHASGDGSLATWPPRSSYGPAEGFGRLYFGDPNLLPNPDMSRQEDGQPASWSIKDEFRGAFSSVDDDGRTVIRWQTPGVYATASQSLRLTSNALYRLEADVRGAAGIYMRARTKERPDSDSRPFTANTKPSETYVHYEVTFTTGEGGDALIILGNTEGMGAGEVFIADLTISRDISYDLAGPAIPIAAGETLRLTDVRPVDCRSLRGFVWGPVDGRLDSMRWDGGVWEYGMRNAGSGVYYDFSGGDGLHVKLTDDGGVDAVQIRNGAKVKLYRDCTSYYEPGDGELLWDFPTNAKSSRALFPETVTSDYFSLFDLNGGLIADLTFLRIEDALDLPEPTVLGMAGPAPAEDLAPFAESRFASEDRVFHRLAADGAEGPVALAEDQFIHLCTEPFDEDTGLLAIGVRLNLPDAATGLPLSIRVQDPFNPRMEVMGADLVLDGPGEAHVIMNHTDQVIPAGKRLWVSVQIGQDTGLAAAEVELYPCSRERAVPEALEYRKLIVMGDFCALSEPRPWGSLRSRDQDLDEWAKKAYAGEKVVELLREAGFAKELGPEDDTVREYDEWLWRRAGIPDFEPRIDGLPGAPEWAIVLRQAWLEAREVPRWWIENRLVPTGELGGRIGDDSDMYQNYADFPMISDDEVARSIVDAAARLAELAEDTTLEAGLNRRTMDPLHAYEEGINQEALMLWWRYGDPVYFERCLLAAKSLPALTTVTDLGHRHFKNQDCGAEDLRVDRPLGHDGHAHPLMLHPAFEVAWYNASPQVIEFLREWADGWLEHQQPGDYATMIDVATEEVIATHKTRPLYGGYGSQASAFMFLYYITGDAKYLRPFSDHYAKGEAPYPSEKRLYELYQAGALDEYTEQHTKLAERSELMMAMLTGDKTSLIDGLKTDIAEMQRFRHMYTTAEQFTDRIFLYAITRAANCYCGGYGTRNKFDHRHACSWEGFDTDFAALVLTARPERFKVLVYNFADEPITGKLRLWTLGHGVYSMTLGPDADGDDNADSRTREQSVEIGRGTRVAIELPAGEVTVIQLTRTQELDPITDRPDLALSPLDTIVEGGAVSGFVHNIGEASVAACEVTLLAADGTSAGSISLGEVSGIEDLEPVRIPYRFADLPDDLTGWRITVDPDDRVTEICEDNNELTLP